MRRAERIIFRVTRKESKLIRAAAVKGERALSDFIRLTLLRAIRLKGKRRKD